jgi:LysM repeat protein
VLAIGAVTIVLAGAANAIGAANATGGANASGAPPASRGAPPASRGDVTKVVIRPGESLWSVAESQDPNADTRQVIQQILQLNSLRTDQVLPGQVLWVPRS